MEVLALILMAGLFIILLKLVGSEGSNYGSIKNGNR